MNFTNYHDTEESKNSNVVQSEQDDQHQISKGNIIVRNYEKTTDIGEEEDSIMYIRNHVERLDELNFDDSDVSIPDEEEIDF